MRIHVLFALLFLPHLAHAESTTADGTWTYRSFYNNPTPVGGDPEKLQQLLFGEGALQLSVAGDRSISGVLTFGANYNMDVSGTLKPGTPDSFSIRAKGRTGTPTAGWIYDYEAKLAPVWPNAIEQVPAFLGTVIRTVPHNGRPAGVTASFIMVKR